MIVRQNIVLIIVALFTFSNSAVATNQSAEEKNQTSLITDSAQQAVQPSKHSILKEKNRSNLNQQNQSSLIWRIIAENILANWYGVLIT